jgi:hypothetical protein
MIWQHGSRTRQDGGTEGEIKKCKDEIRELKDKVKNILGMTDLLNNRIKVLEHETYKEDGQ